jgi:glucose-1-phosphate thymidylyltransferase
VDVFRRLLDRSSPEDQLILGLFHVTRPEKFGMVDMDDVQRVRQINDKPRQTSLKYAWGCIAWRSDFTEHLHRSVNDERVSDFAQIMNEAIAQGMPARGIALPDGQYADMGTYDEIEELERRYRG